MQERDTGSVGWVRDQDADGGLWGDRQKWRDWEKDRGEVEIGVGRGVGGGRCTVEERGDNARRHEAQIKKESGTKNAYKTIYSYCTCS